MYALIMVSVAAFISAQPAATTGDRLVGPVQDRAPLGEHVVAAEDLGDNARANRIALDLPAMAEGAQLRLQILRLKLKVPI